MKRGPPKLFTKRLLKNPDKNLSDFQIQIGNSGTFQLPTIIQMDPNGSSSSVLTDKQFNLMMQQQQQQQQQHQQQTVNPPVLVEKPLVAAPAEKAVPIKEKPRRGDVQNSQ